MHAACGSRWHRLDPARADGLLAVARLLLDAGADPHARTRGQHGRGEGWPVLRCAVAGAANPSITRLLLERGAGIEARDTSWDSTPLDWAAVGSGKPAASTPRTAGDYRP